MPAVVFSWSAEMYTFAMWSRSELPKPKRGVLGLVLLACTPTLLIIVYEPGPGDVAARLT